MINAITRPSSFLKIILTVQDATGGLLGNGIAYVTPKVRGGGAKWTRIDGRVRQAAGYDMRPGFPVCRRIVKSPKAASSFVG